MLDYIFCFCVYIIEKIIAKKQLVMIFMSEEEYNEYREFTENTYIVYENEQELKKDFPNAEIKKDNK